jgi:hypothetical protein
MGLKGDEDWTGDVYKFWTGMGGQIHREFSLDRMNMNGWILNYIACTLMIEDDGRIR